MRLGFIGGLGHHYLRGAVSDPASGVEHPIAVAADGYDAESTRKFADSLGQPITWFDSPLEMLERYRPDAVSVGTIYGFNGDLAALALERDIPVASDKPVAANWDQLNRLRQLTSGHPRRVITTEFDFRCRPEFVAARNAVLAGEIGEPILAVAQKSYRFNTRPAWYADRASYPGTVMWVASHGIDAIPFVTGHRLTSVTGTQGNLSRPNLGQFEDHVVASYELDNGGSGVVHADFLRPTAAATHGDDRLRVIGTAGVVEVRDFRCRLTTHQEPERDITDDAPPPRPMHAELLAALAGKSEKFGTDASLEMAEILLRTRAALDERGVVRLT